MAVAARGRREQGNSQQLWFPHPYAKRWLEGGVPEQSWVEMIQRKHMKGKFSSIGWGLAAGAGLGVFLGAASGVVVWLATGVAFGVLLMAAAQRVSGSV